MKMLISNELLRKDGETSEAYVKRLCDNKTAYQITWKDIQHIVREVLDWDYSVSWYKKYYGRDKLQVNTKDHSDASDMYEILESIKKERMKLADERVHKNTQKRFEAREETIREIANSFAKEMTSKKLLSTPTYPISTEDGPKTAGLLLLSDWHYGMEFKNPFNEFNPSICKDRVSKLLSQVARYSIRNDVDEIVVLNLSDLIAGRIHTQIRIESRFDVITQTMNVAEMLAEFLTELSFIAPVRYGDVLDNHSRLEPNKHDSVDLESLVRIIPWYLKQRLADNNRISFIENEFGFDIITCSILGHDIIGVHGNDDRPATALDKLTLMTHKHYDLLCTAHLHHFNADEKNESIVVGNGSLMGTDNYAAKLRLTSTPSQTYIIVTEDNVTEDIHRIILK